MEELSLDNILTEDQIEDLFEDPNADSQEEKTPEESTTEEVDSNPFEEESKPESVGSEDTENKDSEDTASQGTSSPNFYSSIANALLEEGIFQDLDEEEAKKVQTAEDFAEVMRKQIDNQLDATQKRIAEALRAGIEPPEIQKYENYLRVLDSITEEKVAEESDAGENLRKNLIYQDFINRGYSKEKAVKMVERTVKEGTDIDDAKEALQSNRNFYKEQYDNLLQDAKEEQAQRQKVIQEQAEALRTSILDNDTAFGDIKLDKQTRRKVYDAIMKPSYKDPESGIQLTELQKYEAEHKLDFLKNIGLMYVLTDGFKNLNSLVQGKVKKEVKKGLKELEHTLNNTSRNPDGSLNFMSGLGDPNSKFSGWSLNV